MTVKYVIRDQQKEEEKVKEVEVYLEQVATGVGLIVNDGNSRQVIAVLEPNGKLRFPYLHRLIAPKVGIAVGGDERIVTISDY